MDTQVKYYHEYENGEYTIYVQCVYMYIFKMSLFAIYKN